MPFDRGTPCAFHVLYLIPFGMTAGHRIHLAFGQLSSICIVRYEVFFKTVGLKALQSYIRITCPCDFQPLTSHFYIVKLGFTGVYIFFLLLL